MEEVKQDSQIYVACLASYNNGCLAGKWITPADTEEKLQAQIDEVLKARDMTIQDFGMTYPQVQDFIKQDQQMQAIADAGGVANLAGGGLANLTDTIPPESGPMSQGLRSLYNNGKKL